MSDLDKLYLKRDNDNPNAVYLLLRELKGNGLVMLKEIDTITDDECIKLEQVNDFKKDYYKFDNLLMKENYVNKTGYYEDMCELEVMVYETFVVLYRDNYYELLYDTFGDRRFVNNSQYDRNSFIETEPKKYVKRKRL